jgi:16S rRNA (cytidine1402-2'-O)-methyltransferase
MPACIQSYVRHMSVSSKQSKGVLYLIPNTLGSGADAYATALAAQVVSKVKIYLIEEIKSARRLMRALGYPGDFQDVEFIMLNEHSKSNELLQGLQPLLQGQSMGIISEAGLPCVADPGSDAVLLAHQLGVKVIPLSGPSSILMALMASGLNGQQFTFNGYLPRERHERIKKLKQLEFLALKNHTQLFMDAPYRNNQVLEDICGNVKPDLHLCIATNVTCDNERINTRPVGEWAKKKPDIHKQPVMFVLGL